MKKPSTWFWVIAALFLIWNIFGCILYVVEMTMSDVRYAEVYGAAKASVRDVYPTWAVAAFAVAVWGGLLAAILLLLRRRPSATIFLISVVAAAICFIPVFASTPLREAGGSTFWLMPVIVVVIGGVQVWYARRKIADGTVR